MIDAFLAESDGKDVAELTEDGERISVFENPGLLIRPWRGGEDVVRVLDLDDVFYHRNTTRSDAGKL